MAIEGEVINGDETYDQLAECVKNFPVVMGWTDNEGTHLDILMATHPVQFGRLQRGMHTMTDLFFAVSGFGMFGFELNGSWKSPGYVGEKLGLDGENDTTKALSELINGICDRLYRGVDTER